MNFLAEIFGMVLVLRTSKLRWTEARTFQQEMIMEGQRCIWL